MWEEIVFDELRNKQLSVAAIDHLEKGYLAFAVSEVTQDIWTELVTMSAGLGRGALPIQEEMKLVRRFGRDFCRFAPLASQLFGLINLQEADLVNLASPKWQDTSLLYRIYSMNLLGEAEFRNLVLISGMVLDRNLRRKAISSGLRAGNREKENLKTFVELVGKADFRRFNRNQRFLEIQTSVFDADQQYHAFQTGVNYRTRGGERGMDRTLLGLVRDLEKNHQHGQGILRTDLMRIYYYAAEIALETNQLVLAQRYAKSALRFFELLDDEEEAMAECRYIIIRAYSQLYDLRKDRGRRAEVRTLANRFLASDAGRLFQNQERTTLVKEVLSIAS